MAQLRLQQMQARKQAMEDIKYDEPRNYVNLSSPIMRTPELAILTNKL
jgi:hypothetical protein